MICAWIRYYFGKEESAQSGMERHPIWEELRGGIFGAAGPVSRNASYREVTFGQRRRSSTLNVRRGADRERPVDRLSSRLREAKRASIGTRFDRGKSARLCRCRRSRSHYNERSRDENERLGPERRGSRGNVRSATGDALLLGRQCRAPGRSATR